MRSMRAAVVVMMLGLLASGGCGGAAPAREVAAPNQGNAERSPPAPEASDAEMGVTPRLQNVQPEPPGSPDTMIVNEQMQLYEHRQDLLELESELRGSLTLTAPDCELARGLRDRICLLAGRICDIADRHPQEPAVAEQCGDGRTRCERAGRDVTAACGY